MKYVRVYVSFIVAFVLFAGNMFVMSSFVRAMINDFHISYLLAIIFLACTAFFVYVYLTYLTYKEEALLNENRNI